MGRPLVAHPKVPLTQVANSSVLFFRHWHIISVHLSGSQQSLRIADGFPLAQGGKFLPCMRPWAGFGRMAEAWVGWLTVSPTSWDLKLLSFMANH